jgi:hypothetical protein
MPLLQNDLGDSDDRIVVVVADDVYLVGKEGRHPRESFADRRKKAGGKRLEFAKVAEKAPSMFPRPREEGGGFEVDRRCCDGSRRSSRNPSRNAQKRFPMKSDVASLVKRAIDGQRSVSIGFVRGLTLFVIRLSVNPRSSMPS